MPSPVLLSVPIISTYRTRREVESGLTKGVFGSSQIIVDGEPFGDVDRVDRIEKWLVDGAF